MSVQLVLMSLLAVGSAQFMDDMQIFETECLVEGAFPCASGACIPPEKYCDGTIDCKDGSDENFCVNHSPDAQFCNETHQFMCEDGGMCIPSSWVCNDNNDCKDGSDEVNCMLPEEHKNSTCKSFQCDGGNRCISNFWICDGYYDCDDKSDEDVKKTCHHRPKHLHDTLNCEMSSLNYTCLDKSYCIPFSNMCDGLNDCRDGSDEGAFCSNWHTMCVSHACPPDAACTPSRSGAWCACPSYQEYNATSGRCEESRQCALEHPVCSHACRDRGHHYTCTCEDGYKPDRVDYLCFAPDPEAMLFFSTRNEIRYIKVKSKIQVTVVTGVKQAHGVAYDGKYLYWVETAEGHQAVMKAMLDDVDGTKQVVAALGVRSPGDVSVEHVGGTIYFSDASLGALVACAPQGPCTALRAHTHAPKFVTLQPREGLMYWADFHDRPVIMKAKMDGSDSEILVDKLSSFATGLALDAPNGRLYFVDRTVKVVILKDKRVYSFFEEPFHHPYALAVFENTVFWSDWTTNTIQTADKIHGTSVNRNILLSLDTPVFGMHIYHPVLMKSIHSPCADHSCPLCLLSSNVSSVCVCPDSMEMTNGECQYPRGFPPYLVVSSGSQVSVVQPDAVSAPGSQATHLDLGRVQAMAFDNLRDTLYIYDGQHKSINSIAMQELSLGITNLFMYKGFENIVDMDYDYVSDSLYILDAGRRVVEVISLRNKETALLYRFRDQEIPISFCVLSAYGRMLIAVLETEQNNAIHIDSFGMDGTDRQHLLVNNIRGPIIRMRYSPDMDIVYLSDEGNGIIDFLHPKGTGREKFREVLTTVASLAVTDTHVFWTDRRSTRLYWADVHEASRKIRRIELSMFSNNTHLLLLTTSPPPKTNTGHSCSQRSTPCSHICVQKPHEFTAPGSIGSAQSMGYTCLCPIGLINNNGVCSKVTRCKHHEVYCHRSNECFDSSKRCDGFKDCKLGEDEEACIIPVTQNSAICLSDQTNCNGNCIPKTEVCPNNATTPPAECGSEWFRCSDGRCVERSLACDGHADCGDASDELPAACDTRDCHDTEYMCTSGSCIPATWRCDRSEDCADGSDEIGCDSTSCPSGTMECDGGCLEIYKRCDGKDDCSDRRDEDDCELDFVDVMEQVICAPWEYTCEHNKSICLPLTSRCNGRTDCPGGSDEAGCVFQCGSLFSCAQELWCVPPARVCDGRGDCADGSDETLAACATVNKTKPLLLPGPSCEGYRCESGECVQWKHMCDNKTDCQNGSDDKGLCYPPCAGPAVCSHVCHALKDSFVCSCYRGYRLRADRRSCKALGGGGAEALYSRGGALRARSGPPLHHAPGGLDDLDMDYRRGKIYLASSQTGQLIEVTRDGATVDNITNIGKPNKVAVDWITGNIYFVDITPSNSYMRVCNFDKKRCARLQKLPSESEVTSLIVDPANHLMFYCLSGSSEAHVRSASLSGRDTEDLAAVPSCQGLAANSFAEVLYISTHASIMKVDYDGNHHALVLDHTIDTHHLALFEDYIYFINNSYLIRCLLFGSKTCETQYYLFNASNFILSHESIQRDDVINNCDKTSCSNVCVLGRVAVCVCHDGAVANDGVCPVVNNNELAVFSNVSPETPHGSSWSLLWVLLLLVVLYACAFLHYRLLKKHKPQSGDYMQVRYHNSALTDLSHPVVEISEGGVVGHEFVNPLQFVRNMWRESFERKKPIGTSNLIYETHQDLSDTESDLDVRENRRMIK